MMHRKCDDKCIGEREKSQLLFRARVMPLRFGHSSLEEYNGVSCDSRWGELIIYALKKMLTYLGILSFL
jgi:hypothetical protein